MEHEGRNEGLLIDEELRRGIGVVEEGDFQPKGLMARPYRSPWDHDIGGSLYEKTIKALSDQITELKAKIKELEEEINRMNEYATF